MMASTYCSYNELPLGNRIRIGKIRQQVPWQQEAFDRQACLCKVAGTGLLSYSFGYPLITILEGMMGLTVMLLFHKIYLGIKLMMSYSTKLCGKISKFSLSELRPIAFHFLPLQSPYCTPIQPEAVTEDGPPPTFHRNGMKD